MGFVYFLLMIGVLIFIHEFGHYFFAKLFKVKVERFALGMGPVLGPLTYTKGDTEYCICAFPIGGYVKMFGMQPEELYDEYGNPLPEEEAQTAYVRKPIWQRAIIILAGPLANIILPIFIYFVFVMGNSATLPAEVGHVMAGSPAAMATAVEEGQPQGLQIGDRIVGISGDEVKYWEQLTTHVRGAIEEDLDFTVTRGDQTLHYTVRPASYTNTMRGGFMRQTYGRIGVSPNAYASILGIHDPNSMAAKAGLRTMDRVVAVSGQPVKSYVEFQRALQQHPGGDMTLSVTRPTLAQELKSYGVQFGDALTLTLQAPAKVSPAAFGVRPAQMFLAAIEPGSPADEAGLKAGDEILKVDGEDFNDLGILKQNIQQRFWAKMHDSDTKPTDIQVPLKLTVQRAAQTLELDYQPKLREFVIQFNEPTPIIWFGFKAYSEGSLPDMVSMPLSDRASMGISTGLRETYNQGSMIFNGLAYMIRNGATNGLGGPLMIGDIAAQAGAAGWKRFLDMMALISLNLGLLNLLPIPVLDGGHLLLLAIEAIKRRELSARTRQVAYYIGFSFIVLMMLLAFTNDINRYWPSFAEWFNG